MSHAIDLLGTLKLDNFPQSIRDRLNRINIVTHTMVASCSVYDLQLHCTVIPQGQSFPLHSRPGTTYVQKISGKLELRDFIVTSIEEQELQPNNIEESMEVRGFIDVGDEEGDCVCRGGICPRRFGCPFWVDYQLRTKGKYLLSRRKHTNFGDTMFIRRQDQGPREYKNVGGDNSIILELLQVQEDVTNEAKLTTQYYHRAKSLDNSNGNTEQLIYKVTTQEKPFGILPQKLVGLRWDNA